MSSDNKYIFSGLANYLSYRAWSSVYGGLVEDLTHGEGHMSSANAGGCLYGQSLSLLLDLNRGPGCCRYSDFPQKDIYA